MMTKPHFEALAMMLRKNQAGSNPNSEVQTGRRRQWENDCVAVATVCDFFNPAFNLKRFLLACGFDHSDAERYCR